MRGAAAKEFLKYQDEHKERLAAEGRTLVHYWGSGSGSDALAFNGKPEVDQLARGEKPIHLCPFINHSSEGEPDHNVQAVHIRVSRCFCFKSLFIFHIDARLAFWSLAKRLFGLYYREESSQGNVSSRKLYADECRCIDSGRPSG